MRRVIAILALLVPAIAFADLCGSNTERVYTLAASTVTTVGVGLSGRKQITVCSSNANTATSVVQCRGDGTEVTLGDANVGIQLARGQCRVFGSPASVAISCVSNESSVVVKTEECTGSAPPPAVVNGPPASTSVTGSVTANQGSAGSASWPTKGDKTNNSAVPGATNIGTLPAVANAVAPTLTETYQAALSTTLSGNLRTTTAGARAGDSGECLILTTAGGTPCPATPLASRREIALFNLGPNPIYCALGASVPAVGTGNPIYPTGWLSFPAGAAVPVTCIAATANQVTTAATSYSEVAQ